MIKRLPNRAMHLTVAFGAAGDRRPFQDSPSGLRLSAGTVLALGIHIAKGGRDESEQSAVGKG